VKGRYVLLLIDDQGGPVAVGPFSSAAAAERWEQRWPHLGDDVQGVVRLVGPAEPLSEVGVRADLCSVCGVPRDEPAGCPGPQR
jgi:hypothetical protein